MRILIAEDDLTSRSILRAILTKWGFDPVVTEDGDAAWAALQRPDAPKLVLLDWNMPGLDGLEVCRRIRKVESSDPPYIILLTGHGAKSEIVQGLEAGANDHLAKPYDSEELQARIRVGERMLELQARLLEARDVLAHQATHDALTGMLNRRAIMERLVQELARARREGGSLSLGMLDLDHFKKVNDDHGHQVGDEVLVGFAQRIQAQLRAYDCMGRYGGEEFLVFAVSPKGQGDGGLFERLCAEIGRVPIQTKAGAIPITVSIGVERGGGQDTVDALLAAADAALYEAKAAGRNRVAYAKPAGESGAGANRGMPHSPIQAAALDEYRILFERSRDAIMTLAPPSWRFTAGNPATVRMFGAASEEDFKAHPPWALSPERQPDGCPSAEKAREMIETAMREGAHFFEWTHARIGGEEFPASVLLTRMEVGGETFLQATVRDISAQKYTEGVLRESERRYRALFEGAAEGILVADAQTRTFRFANPAICALLGYTAVELANMGVESIHPVESLPAVLAVFEAEARGDRRTVSALPCLRKNGELLYANVSTSRVDIGGRPHLVGFFTDVTERKRTEAQLRLQSTAMEAVAEAIVIADRNGIVSWINPAFTLLTGYAAADIVGRPASLLAPEQQPDEAYREIQQVVSAGGVWRGELLNRCKDGSLYNEEVTITPVCDDEGVVVNQIAIKRDISERKRIEAELQSAKGFLDRVINAIADPVFVKDDARRFVLVNDALCRIVGRPREELQGKDGDDMFPGEQVSVFRKVDDQVLATGEENLNEEALSDLSTGKVRTIVTRKARYVDPAGKRFIVGVIRDMTEQRALEARLREFQRIESIGTLARGMAHEINNPIMGVINYAQLIRDRADGSASLVEFADEIMAESKRVAKLTHSLLAVAGETRTESMVPVALNDIVASVLAPVRVAAQQRGIELSCTIAADLPPVSCRRDRVGQAILALLANAMEALDERDAGRDGTKKIMISAETGARNAERKWESRSRRDEVGSEEGPSCPGFRMPHSASHVRLTVEDNGPGIAVAIRERVYDPFFTTKSRTQHSGLGLWVVRSVVQEHAGELSMESEVGKGTRFHVDFPAEREAGLTGGQEGRGG